MYKRLGLALFFGAAALCAEEVKLMFGGREDPGGGEKFLDFRYVSQKDPLFTVKTKLDGWNYNPRGGATYGSFSAGSLPADQILEHGIACRNATLTIPFKEKKAVMRFWIGDWFAGQRRMWGTTPVIRLKVNGKTVHETKMTTENAYREWCRLDEYVYSRKDGIWERLVKPVLSEYTVEVHNPDGKIRIDMTNILLTALVIVPDRTTLDRVAAAMEQERRKQFAARYPWTPQPDEAMPRTDEKDLILFQKHGLDTVHPWSRPVPDEITGTIRVFAAQGEQEMFRFGILPVRDLKKLTVSIGDFKGSGGTIPLAGNADIWRERYKEKGSEETRGKIRNIRRLDPVSYVLQENRPQDAEAGTPRMYIVDVAVPEKAQPGDYYAPLSISADGKILCNARLRLKVLPFRLQYEGAAPYSFQASDGLPWAAWRDGATREGIRRKLEDRVRFLEKYHFQNAYFCPWGYAYPVYFRYGTVSGKPGERQFTQTPEQAATMDWWFQLIRPGNSAGFVLVCGNYLFMNCSWHIPNIFQACRKGKPDAKMENDWNVALRDIERLVRQITEIIRRKYDCEPYWYFTGELDNFGLRGTQEAVRLADAIRRGGGTSFVTINGPLAYRLAPPAFDHVWANPATPVDENLKAAVEKYGHKFGAHNSGDTRFQAGFQFWRTGGEGRFQETQFYTNFMLPYVYLPWNYNTAQVYPAPDGGDRPSLPFLNYRDGRDDYLYLFTLENRMRKADRKSAAFLEASDFLKHMRKKIHFDPRMYHAEKFDGIEGTASINESEWNATSIERYRWQIAKLIMALGGEK